MVLQNISNLDRICMLEVVFGTCSFVYILFFTATATHCATIHYSHSAHCSALFTLAAVKTYRSISLEQWDTECDE